MATAAVVALLALAAAARPSPRAWYAPEPAALSREPKPLRATNLAALLARTACVDPYETGGGGGRGSGRPVGGPGAKGRSASQRPPLGTFLPAKAKMETMSDSAPSSWRSKARSSALLIVGLPSADGQSMGCPVPSGAGEPGRFDVPRCGLMQATRLTLLLKAVLKNADHQQVALPFQLRHGATRHRRKGGGIQRHLRPGGEAVSAPRAACCWRRLASPPRTGWRCVILTIVTGRSNPTTRSNK